MCQTSQNVGCPVTVIAHKDNLKKAFTMFLNSDGKFRVFVMGDYKSG